MKTITLKQAFELLEDSSAIIADDNILAYAGLNDLEDDESNIFLEIRWTDDDDFERHLRFSEGDNQIVNVSGSSLFLKEKEADEIQITILTPQNLE